jgi:uncharacterized membrane protein YhhN
MSWLFFIAGLFAVANWYAVAVAHKKIEYVAKPATLISLLLAYALNLAAPLEWWQIAYGLGLLFSLGGDVFLMLPNDQFVPGLASFLLAQIAYILVFNVEGLQLDLATLLMAVAIALIAVPVISTVVGALRESNRGQLVIPVIAYAVFLSLMFWSAASTLYRPGWTRLSAGLMVLGGASFFLSDSILAFNRFVKPIKRARLIEMFTYHIAQFALTLGILLHWGFL